MLSNLRCVRTCLFLALATLAAVLLSAAPAFAQGFNVAAPVCKPGWGGSDPSYLNPVLLYEFSGFRPLVETPEIPGNPPTFINDPSFAAFSARGELFIANRHGNRPGATISRFAIDAKGNWVYGGIISGNGLAAVHGLAFSRKGELFACNLLGHSISRFTFDSRGHAIPNGDFPSVCMGLAFDRSGELFVSTGYSSRVNRYLFDDTGTVVDNGYFEIPGMSGPHGLTFSIQGELFIADVFESKVFRVLFDRDGTARLNGSFDVPEGPFGVAFSPPGELFVSSHWGGIYRFLFDKEGNPVANGIIATPWMGALAIWP